jgi:hypothetical protein
LKEGTGNFPEKRSLSRERGKKSLGKGRTETQREAEESLGLLRPMDEALI